MGSGFVVLFTRYSPKKTPMIMENNTLSVMVSRENAKATFFQSSGFFQAGLFPQNKGSPGSPCRKNH